MQFWAGSQIRVGEDAARAAREAHGVNGAAPVLVQQGHIPVGQPLGPAGQALEAGPAGIPTREPSRFSSMKMRFIEMWRSIEMKLTKMFDFSWTRRQWNRKLGSTVVRSRLPYFYTIPAEGLPGYFRTDGYIVQDENKMLRVLAHILYKDQNKHQMVMEEIDQYFRYNLGEPVVHTTENGSQMSQLTSHLFEHGVDGRFDDIAAFAKRNKLNIAVVYQGGGISHAEYFNHKPYSRYSHGIIIKDGSFELLSA
ncbi:hypothetical protein MJO29_006546, partial [Puccinia striiformis f. sp. tritici]